MTVVHVTAPMLAAYDHFLAVGFLENGAGAAVGNFCQESGEFLIPTMFRAHPDASGGVPDALKSGGIAEWLGARKTAYIAFADRAEARLGLAKGSLINDLGTQCDFVVYELQTNPRYATLYNWLTVESGRSIATLTYNFCWIYEDPAKETANLDNRVAHAEAVVAKARLLKTPTGPQPAPPASIPQVPATQVPPHVPGLPAAPTGQPIIPALWAARLAIELDQLISLQTAYRAEFPTPFDEAITALQKLGSASTLQLPAADPAAIAPQGIQTVFGITNWKTTIGGIAAILTAAGTGIHAFQSGDLSAAYESIPAILAGIALIGAKDNNVTGGTVAQTVEAQQRAKSSPIK